MRAIASAILLSVVGLGMAWAQPVTQAPVPPAPAVAETPPAPPPPPAEGAPEGLRAGGQSAERAWRREGGQPQIPAAFMERLRQERPELHERLSRLYQEDRQRFFQEVRGLMREAQGPGLRGRRDSPEEQKCTELSRLYREAKDPAEKERLKAELSAAVSAAFGARLRASQERVARLEKQLGEFRQNLERLETNREQICAERLEELTKPAELRWDGNW